MATRPRSSASGLPTPSTPAIWRVFRNHYPEGDNYVVAHDVERPLERDVSGVRLTVVNPADLVARIGA